MRALLQSRGALFGGWTDRGADYQRNSASGRLLAMVRYGRRIASSNRRCLLELAELAVSQDDDANGRLSFALDRAYIWVVARRWR